MDSIRRFKDVHVLLYLLICFYERATMWLNRIFCIFRTEKILKNTFFDVSFIDFTSLMITDQWETNKFLLKHYSRNKICWDLMTHRQKATDQMEHGEILVQFSLNLKLHNIQKYICRIDF